MFSCSGIKVTEGFSVISNIAATTPIAIIYTYSDTTGVLLQDTNLTGKCLQNVKQSAISDHLLQRNCTINFDNFAILAAESNKFKLLLRESLLIKHDKPVLNRTIKSFPLELFD